MAFRIRSGTPLALPPESQNYLNECWISLNLSLNATLGVGKALLDLCFLLMLMGMISVVPGIAGKGFMEHVSGSVLFRKQRSFS